MTNLIGISGKAGSGKDLIASIIQYLIWRNNVEKGIIGLSNYNLEHFKVAPSLSENLSKWKVVKFADKLKDIVCLLTGCTRADLEDREFKEQELGEEWWKYPDEVIYKVLCDDGTDFESEILYFTNEKEVDEFFKKQKRYKPYDMERLNIIKPTPRFILQYIGTDLFRNQLHANTWVNATFSDYKPLKLSEYNPSKWLISDVRFPNELKAIKDRSGICIRVSRPLPRLPIEPDPHISESALDDSDDFDYMVINDGTIDDLVEKVKEILIKENII